MANERTYLTNYQDQRLSNLYQGLWNQYTSQVGVDVYYMPLQIPPTNDNVDSIWGETKRRVYNKIHGMRIVLEDTTILAGQDMFSKFGVDLQNELVIYTSRQEFINRITGNPDYNFDLLDVATEAIKFDDSHDLHSGYQYEPHISDLIFLPIWNGLFEVTYVEYWDNIVFGTRAFWKLICKRATIGQDTVIEIDQTGNPAIVPLINMIDEIERQKIIDATNQYDQTGLTLDEAKNTTNIINDDTKVEGEDIKPKIPDDLKDIFSSW